MINIELFNAYTAIILSQLYESFPVKCDLDVRTISGHDEFDDFGAICAPDGRRSKQAEVAFSTIEWLIDNGYIQASDKRYPLGFSCCTLSQAGLNLLNAVPEGVQGKETFGARLIRLTREGSATFIAEAVKTLLTQALSS